MWADLKNRKLAFTEVFILLNFVQVPRDDELKEGANYEIVATVTEETAPNVFVTDEVGVVLDEAAVRRVDAETVRLSALIPDITVWNTSSDLF